MNILIVADEPRPDRAGGCRLPASVGGDPAGYAIRYAGTGGAVPLRLAAAGNQAVLTVHNTGTPIPPDRLPHIFERFYRADPSHTGSGTGLGLVIAQSICQAHHAAIRAESGQDGTTFRVEIRKEQGEHHGN